MLDSHHKIAPHHLARSAVVYVRQSSMQQVRSNHESRTLQYRLEDRARALGWNRVEIVDEDLGISAGGCGVREGFDRLVSCVTRAEVGIIFCLEASRLSRNCRYLTLTIQNRPFNPGRQVRACGPPRRMVHDPQETCLHP